MRRISAHLLVLCSLGLGLNAPSQSQFSLAKASPATTGQQLVYRYDGAPAGKIVLFLVDVTTGPIPLAVLNPNDPRLLCVGTNLSVLWMAQPSITGTGTFSLPLPVAPVLNGLEFFAVATTVPGNPFLMDEISNCVTAQVGAKDTWTTLPNKLPHDLALAYGVPRPDLTGGRGDIALLAGGRGTLTNIEAATTTPTYHWHNMALTASTTSPFGAIGTATVLKSGKVLVAGGVTEESGTAGFATAECFIYDPATGGVQPTSPMSVRRTGHAATLLDSGEVMVAGGTNTLSDPVQALAQTSSTVEKWDPATGKWTPMPDMPDALILPSMTTLQNGFVMVAGGYDVNFLFGIPFPVGSVTNCSFYNPFANSWSNGPPMNTDRCMHTYNTTLLKDGSVLVVGGAQAGIILTSATATDKAERFFPMTSQWVPVPDMDTVRFAASVNEMSNGLVVVAGGGTGTFNTITGTNSVQRYDPLTNSWAKLGDLAVGRAGHVSTVTPDGLLLVLGGLVDPQHATRTIEALHQ